MITIYRIEHKKEKRNNGMGYGPYNTGSISIKGYWPDDMRRKHTQGAHPSMVVDLPDFYSVNYSELYCGFKSIDELKSWFRGFLTDIKLNGFVIKKYLVSEITESFSGKQIFFDYKKVIASENY